MVLDLVFYIRYIHNNDPFDARVDPFSNLLSLIKRFPAISNKYWSSTSMKL